MDEEKLEKAHILIGRLKRAKENLKFIHLIEKKFDKDEIFLESPYGDKIYFPEGFPLKEFIVLLIASAETEVKKLQEEFDSL